MAYAAEARAQFVSLATPLQRSLGSIAVLSEQFEVKWHHYVAAPITFPAVLKYNGKTLQQMFDAFHLSREVQAVLSANAGDFLAPPNKLSWLLYAALMGAYGTGAYYPTKHFKTHIDLITERITSTKGCEVFYESKVTAFGVESGALKSVTTQDGKVFKARKGFICNMDPQSAAKLIGLEHFEASYREKLAYEYSDSALIVYLGLKDIDLRKHGFGRHNTWRVTQWDMNQAWKEQVEDDNHQNPWMFISTPSLLTDDPHHTPPGGQIMELATSLSYPKYKELKARDPGAYRSKKRAVAERLLDLVEEHHVPNLRKHIKVRLVGSPTTNEDFAGAPMGNAYGASLTPRNLKNRLAFETPIRGLYWCNATAGYPSLAGTTSSGINLYTKLTGDRILPAPGEGLSREQKEQWAISEANRRASKPG